MQESKHVVVIGGGPSGATLATYLASAGVKVTLYEKELFPRQHIGESLLAASVPYFRDLGIEDKLEKAFIRKPGGRWRYSPTDFTYSDFSDADQNSSFHNSGYSYLVKRDEFDQILLDRAREAGVEIHFEQKIKGVIQEGGAVRGIKVENKTEQLEIKTDMVFDCSGYGAVVSRALKLRESNPLKRMAIFAQIKAEVIDSELKNGWFVGELLHNGWVWGIPLNKDIVSVGMVLPVSYYKEAKSSAPKIFEHYMKNVDLLKNGFAKDYEMLGKPSVYGNLGFTSTKFCGDGWALVGDAAFFIDPCYSSGVHLALWSAKKAANCYLESLEKQNYETVFAQYEKDLRRHEKIVQKLVDTLYIASRNRFVRWLLPKTVTPSIQLKFTTITGGDFAKYSVLTAFSYYAFKTLSFLIPFEVPKDELGVVKR